DENGSVETALLSIDGEQTLSFVASWIGTIQWIGESEIRKDHKRKNWFIGIFVVESADNVEVKDTDISYQAMRSSGAGGQHVNKVSSAIRATHLTTGIQVVAMDSRSQHQNKKLAYERLLVKIREKHLESLKTNELTQWKNQMQIERGNPALDAYPYNLEEAIESLDYALSGDNNNAATLCLYGRVYAEQLQDYATAKTYFQDALAADIKAV
ncbi:unnamed protein product, partial [Darwinula stevensoni]